MEDWKLLSIASVAPTLNDLKRLSARQQSCLLLRRLATLYPTQSCTFHRQNMRLPMTLDIPLGFPDSEKSAVLDFLLARPWHELLNAGYITDRSGNGFFCITEEGYQAAIECASLLIDSTAPEVPAELPANFDRIAAIRFRNASAELYEGPIQTARTLSINTQTKGLRALGNSSERRRIQL